MNIGRDDSWLLEPPGHSTYPLREEKLTVRQSMLSSGNIGVVVYHPEAPANPDDNRLAGDIAICAPGWTEPGLEAQSRALARIGMHAASFNHPRQGALRDLWSVLQASRKLRTNWRELSNAIWDERDLEHAEDILVDMIADQIADKDDRKTLLKSAVSAGRLRRDNLMSVVSTMRESGYNVQLLGHSLGGVDAAMATCAMPDDVQSLTLAGPGGLMVNDSVMDIIPRIASTVVWERTELIHNVRELARMTINTVLFVAENPILTLYEGGFAATSRLEKSLWDIMAEHRIPSVLVLGGKDKMFPTAVVAEDARTIPFAGKIILPEAGHNMTTHQTADVARIVYNAALDVKNRRSGRLEANMENLLATRRGMRPQNAFTAVDMEEDLFSR